MAIQFVRNYQDLSTDRGYQFKFDCDHCGNGYMTAFQASAMGTAQSVLRAAGDIFGGVFNRVGEGAFEMQRMVGGPAHDHALEQAVSECKGHFQQCTRCGRWVCPEVCWNAAARMCKGCAPRFEEEFAHAHAEAKANAARSQLADAAGKIDYVGQTDMRGVVAAAPVQAQQGVSTGGTFCTACGGAMGEAKFCQQCGTPRAATACKCGAAIVPGTKFCGDCGAKLG